VAVPVAFPSTETGSRKGFHEAFHENTSGSGATPTIHTFCLTDDNRVPSSSRNRCVVFGGTTCSA
jgi:hypothetical protein